MSKHIQKYALEMYELLKELEQELEGFILHNWEHEYTKIKKLLKKVDGR